MANITLKNVTKRFDKLETIHSVNLELCDGEFVVFVGPSGCGKSTLLRLIAGLEEITEGVIEIGDKNMNNIAPANRGVAMVFQSYALYPHMSVRENMSFGMEMRGESKENIHTRITKASHILQLDELLDRKPRQLSGGQRQRVAIGRAIVREPDVFLFDEPLSNLDAELRVDMRIQIAQLHKKLKATMIYVTHDQVEAMTLADKIVVLRAGHIEQVGSPMELYHNPNNMFVAGFIGSPKMNFLPALISDIEADNSVIVAFNGQKILFKIQSDKLSIGDPVTLGFRPEHIHLAKQEDGFHFDITVDVAEHLGGISYLYSRFENNNMTIEVSGENVLTSGDVLSVGIKQSDCYLFDQAGKTLIERVLPNR
ncbi:MULTISPECIES: ABC transporter ATP-binding protein [Marinomonas]|uniref:sn-glycerol-3-phosphate ABC transporter ATP-binding protein UgpC n=1 Tax=Marinomonas arctica TaxID=383750 RepID=A0A7H1J862_9GAMM|nr:MULTISPECIES: sn-glycerol-3-phosphate ABC transporter ATP-binding protein UgpC [Marinomonas]MCS7486676.1 ABC transporter [Marinomonas sp. BSi20414]QNT06678.1 sn-glycerol-3-phosphate ABC transporter ATP-binding protein UgpC [Marinomonas arctica]GGN22688.1 sugar ABC transporter ATP-binding protein [Marinomonas arctica]